MPSLRLSWIHIPGFFAGSPLSEFTAASTASAFPCGLTLPLPTSCGSCRSGKPLLRSPPSTGRFRAAQGRRMPEPNRTLHRPAVLGCVPDLLRISFRRLAHTGRISVLNQNLHLPARAGNVHFQFVTGLPTDGTMRLVNLWMQVQKTLKSVDITTPGATAPQLGCEQSDCPQHATFPAENIGISAPCSLAGLVLPSSA
jgi:hypothetical protein